MAEHVVTSADELGEGERLVVELEGREIGIFNIDGEYRAYLNWCAHQSGPVCEGITSGTLTASYDRDALEVNTEWEQEGEIINCPWHGWEFDLTSGECLSKRGVALPSYPVSVRDGQLVVTL